MSNHTNIFSAEKPTLVVYSHPNHELATYGLIKRIKPHIIFLTDGGSDKRLRQTREGLNRIGLLDRATFLNHLEDAFYDALLRRDAAFYADIAEIVGKHATRVEAEQLFCDAVEFYNPVHDMGLPITRAAIAGRKNTRLFEMPLIFQSLDESFTFQRPPKSCANESLELKLSPEEFGRKVAARDNVYTILVQQLAPQLSKFPLEHWLAEYVFAARREVPRPDAEMLLRYEQRAAMLLERGQISEKVLYHEHYVPVASALFNVDETIA